MTAIRLRRETSRYVRLNELVHAVRARRIPTTVSVVDFAGAVCPGGPPCPRTVDGINLRPLDGLHFTPETASWAAQWLLDAVLACRPGTAGWLCPAQQFTGTGSQRGPQVASPAMTDAAVGGLESAAEPRGPERITFPCFDGFRALAALVVLVTHVAFLSGFNGRSRLGAFTARMDVGVAIFFMISGFLLYRPFVAARLAGLAGPRRVAYFWRRGLRILPAYWVALTVTVFVLHVPKELPSVGDLFLFYGLFHLYSLGNVIGPILSSYTLVTEISFYVFLPLYALAISRWAHGEPKRVVRIDLVVLGCLIVAGIVYRWVIRSRFDGQRAFQLLNILPGWVDVFAVGMALAVVSVWLAGRREPTVFRRRVFPARVVDARRRRVRRDLAVDGATGPRSTRSARTWACTTSIWPWACSSCCRGSSAPSASA